MPSPGRGRLYLAFSEIDGVRKIEALVCLDSSKWSKTETSWNPVLSSQKDALFKGKLREASFLVDLSSYLFEVTIPSYEVFTFKVALIPC